MNKITLLISLLGLGLPLYTQAGTLSRTLTDQEFTVTLAGSDRGTTDQSKNFKLALDQLTEKLSGGIADSISLNGKSVDYYIDNFGFQNNDLVVYFDRIKVMQILKSQNIPLYLGTRPDVMVWMSIFDEKYNTSDIMSESNANSFTSSLLQTGSGLGLKFYLPIMDSDDAVLVNDRVIQDFDANALGAANNRYATKYYVVGTIQGYNTENGDLVWKLYDVSSGAPIYQSVAHGVPYDLGNIVAKEVVKYFAKLNPEYISDEDVPPTAESSGFSQEKNKELDQAKQENTSIPSSPRAELFGGMINNNKARIVISNVVKFQDVIFVEKSLKGIEGVSKVMLSQSQADQLVYELSITKDFNAISQKLSDIAGLYIPDQSKPFNYYFDALRKNEAKVETATTGDQVQTEAVKTETVGQEKVKEKVATTESQQVAPVTTDVPAKTEKATPQTGGYEEMEAIPIMDPTSVQDTSNRKL